jgi:NAD(P)-dependent dehydrogenase (short-subunit alcohol dehydrogenase family)
MTERKEMTKVLSSASVETAEAVQYSQEGHRMIGSGRVAVITGAAQGIGKRTSELLAERGYRLLLNDLRPLAKDLGGARRLEADVLEVLGDISDEAVVSKIAAAARERWGRTDVLVNNAGVSLIAPAEKLSAADYRRVLEINLVAPFLLARAFGAMMLEQGVGSIINVASVAGLVGVADRAAYNASKHGLIGLTRTLAAEWGGRGVRVNAVCPAWVKTEMDVADQAAGGYTDADITGRVPMGRFASPDDVARAIAFLADSQESGYINGHALVVDGGWIADGSWEALRLRHR